MNKVFSILFLFFFSVGIAQKYSLQGCEKTKNRKVEEYCFKNFNDAYTTKFNETIKKYGDKVPQGKTYLQFTIGEDGSMNDLKYLDYDNLQFAKLTLAVLFEVKNELEKLNLKFFPVIDNETGAPVQFIHKFPVALKWE